MLASVFAIVCSGCGSSPQAATTTSAVTGTSGVTVAPSTSRGSTTSVPSPSSPLTADPLVAVTVTESDNGRMVAVAHGNEVLVTLHSTYWSLQPIANPTVLALLGGPQVTPAGGCVPGAGCGTVTARYQALAPGQATITATRQSCGEALSCSPSAGTFRVTVVVTASAG